MLLEAQKKHQCEKEERLHFSDSTLLAACTLVVHSSYIFLPLSSLSLAGWACAGGLRPWQQNIMHDIPTVTAADKVSKNLVDQTAQGFLSVDFHRSC